MIDPLHKPTDNGFLGQRVVRRVSFLIPIFGICAGALVGVLGHWDWTPGLLLGAALAWLNYYWLKRGIGVFTGAVTERDADARPTSGAVYVAAALRYALIGLGLYVIVDFLHVSLLSLVVGLCAFAAAIITATVWEITQSAK